ncbi:reverse transcriptase domain, reverse transcriptase zinc-binding domain protein [Tanacetum coccineum]
MSPYLFTLVIEVITLMLHRRVRESDSFTYHRYCSDLNIINLCFADDLFLFAHGDANSARVIMDSLEEFKNVSGLTPSLPKSTAYFCNVLNYVKLDILSILPFEEGKLPIKYLGVPLVFSRLIFRDCTELVEKVRERIRDWKNKFLSFAGRVQLIRSVLASMHVYWASVFILPSRIMMDLEQLMRGFLWCQGEMRKGKAKVAWEVVCLPKTEGGLGIRRLEAFNKALITSHIWSILSLKGSTSARNLPEQRSKADIKFSKFLYESAYGVGLQLSSKVNEIIDHGNWVWPEHWYSKFPDLSTLNVLILDPNSVWEQVKTLIGIPNMPSTLDLIVEFLIPLAKKRSARCIIVRLVFATSCYFIWQERNNRLFVKQKRSYDQIIEVIQSNVRLKLLSCKFKKTKIREKVLDVAWKFYVHSWSEECQLRVVLLFPSPRFFSLGFSWEDFLRMQSQLAYFTPSVVLMARCEDSCLLKWFLPIGVLVSVSC